ncbi:MAG: HAMP domain-containing protein [Burkholderiaceae bacterium]|nr:MAG: HAMP domain-containing protein [Burkholderiaceae bacterium]
MRLVSTRLLRYILMVAGGVAGVLLFILASASANSSLFARHYSWLLGVNAFLAAMLLLLVIVLLRRLWRRYKRGVFGSRLMLRLALSFALMGVIPGATIYLVSVQFLSKSIESWFNVRVDNALESGLNLGRSALDTLLSDLMEKARFSATALSEQPESMQFLALSRLRDQQGVADMLLLSGSGQILASAGGRMQSLLPQSPSAQVLRQARENRLYAAVEDESDAKGKSSGLRLRVVIVVNSSTHLSMMPEVRYLQLLQPVPSTLAANADEVQNVYRDYQELSLSRSGLRRIYTVTLTLTLTLAMLAAIATAFLLAGWLAEPLLQLAQGTKAVAEGDFRQMAERSSNDELSVLTRSFNAMTRQLDEARVTVEHNRAALENAKTFLESILANMSAGVLVFDSQFRLATVNLSASRIFGLSDLPTDTPLLQQGATLEHAAPPDQMRALHAFVQLIRAAFVAHADDTSSPHWQQQIELERGGGGDAVSDHPLQQSAPFVLLARGSRLPVNEQPGYVVVFDDISDVISAQRSAAWGEVARRLAHEIKNPLTPIQLSAERLQMKLGARVAGDDQAMLKRATDTIINQVTAMKRMVDEFRDYARMPPALLHPLNLNELIRDVLHLYGDSAPGGLIQTELAPALPLIQGDAGQLRQLIHNLLQNAQDALSEPVPGHAQARIVIATELTGNQWVRLRVEDNGSGFPARILSRAFEPYVTSKPKGTGLGLAIVKKIVEEHQGRIDLHNRLDAQQQVAGARVTVSFPCHTPDV